MQQSRGNDEVSGIPPRPEVLLFSSFAVWRAPPTMPRAIRVGFAIVGLALLAYLVAALLTTREERPGWWDAQLYVGLEALVGLLAVARVVRYPVERPGWGLVAAGTCCIPAGDLVSSFSERSARGLPTLAEYLYAGFVLLTFLGLVLIMRRRIPEGTATAWLDGLIGGTSVTSVGAATLYRNVLGHSPTLWGAVAATAYPLGILVLIALMTGALAALGRRPSRIWWMVVVALSLMATANARLAFAVADGTYVRGAWVDVLWPAALLLMAWASWTSVVTPLQTRSTSTLSVATPSVFALAALCVLAVDHASPRPLVAVVLAFVTLLLAAARMTLAVNDAISLGQQEQELSARLAEARDAAVAAAAAKTTFLATMSHEIRTPLNAVLGMTTLTLNTDLDSRQRSYVETILRSGDLLLDLVDDALDYSKIESGRLDLEQRAFELEDVVHQIGELLRGTAVTKGIDLVVVVDDRCPAWVLGDPTRLRQVLMNLVANAVKFTARGEVRLEVAPVPGSGRTSFAVHDTGMGISPEGQRRLFQAFTQVDTSINRLHGGTGLGLVISQSIVERMGGRITVQSVAGAGSVFRFEAELPAVAAPGDVARHLQGRQVLVVAAEGPARDRLRSRLQSWGARVSLMDPSEPAAPTSPPVAAVDVAIVRLRPHGSIRLLDRLRAGHPGTVLPVLVLVDDDLVSEPVRQDACTAILPAVATDTRLRDALRRLLTTHSPDAAAVKSLTILLAEDNPINQRVGRLLLERAGHEVDTVADGAEAIEAVLRRRYDVVLMDVQMPVMGGLEATRRLRATCPGGGPPVVALTAAVAAADRDACRAAGMDDYLSKPLRPDKLAALLATLPTAATRSRQAARSDEGELLR